MQPSLGEQQLWPGTSDPPANKYFTEATEITLSRSYKKQLGLVFDSLCGISQTKFP